jgi:transforming growth factor-beta-induced protein
MKPIYRLFLLIAVISLALGSFLPAAASAPKRVSIVDKVKEINAATGEFSTLLAAMQATGVDKYLDASFFSYHRPNQFNFNRYNGMQYQFQTRRQFTVFGPTDAAFAKLGLNASNIATAFDTETLRSILWYHIARREYKAAQVISLSELTMLNREKTYITVIDLGAFINGSKIIQTDVDVDNGVIHVIDSVLLAPKDIVDTAVADGRFTTLVAAVQAAGLVDTLKSSGPFTVFAPTDDAFAKLPAGTVETLLKPENLETLKQILLYHVAPGRLWSSDVIKLSTLETAAGIPVRIQVMDGKVYINNAQVIITDIWTSNGIIHVIDSVLLPPKDIVDTAVADGRFTTLVAAVQAAGLVDTLKSKGPFTVFAPTDDAFAKLPAGTVEELLKPENLMTLKQILLYHVVPGFNFAADVVKESSFSTAAGLPVQVKVMDGKVYINDSQVIITDIFTANGVIHVIDSVLLPPQPKDIVDIAVADGRFTTLVAAVQAAGLVDTLKSEGPFTVFAPTDDAFAKLPAGTVETLLKPENLATLKQILLYHVVPGKVMAADVVTLSTAGTAAGIPVRIQVKDGKVYINDAQVIITDIVASNGVIHVIDSVLLPPKDIVDTAVADGRFTTLVAALQAAGLVDTLKGPGPFTVFAPTDDAFAKLPAGTVNELLKPENLELLQKILLYHVAPGFQFASDVVMTECIKTVNGLELEVKVMDGKVYINNAQVIIADIFTANGVIHVIDSVLLP